MLLHSLMLVAKAMCIVPARERVITSDAHVRGPIVCATRVAIKAILFAKITININNIDFIIHWF